MGVGIIKPDIRAETNNQTEAPLTLTEAVDFDASPDELHEGHTEAPWPEGTVETTSGGYSYEHGDVIQQAPDAATAIAQCRFLGNLAKKNPEAANSFLKLATMHKPRAEAQSEPTPQPVRGDGKPRPKNSKTTVPLTKTNQVPDKPGVNKSLPLPDVKSHSLLPTEIRPPKPQLPEAQVISLPTEKRVSKAKESMTLLPAEVVFATKKTKNESATLPQPEPAIIKIKSNSSSAPKPKLQPKPQPIAKPEAKPEPKPVKAAKLTPKPLPMVEPRPVSVATKSKPAMVDKPPQPVIKPTVAAPAEKASLTPHKAVKVIDIKLSSRPRPSAPRVDMAILPTYRTPESNADKRPDDESTDHYAIQPTTTVLSPEKPAEIRDAITSVLPESPMLDDVDKAADERLPLLFDDETVETYRQLRALVAFETHISQAPGVIEAGNAEPSAEARHTVTLADFETFLATQPPAEEPVTMENIQTASQTKQPLEDVLIQLVECMSSEEPEPMPEELMTIIEEIRAALPACYASPAIEFSKLGTESEAEIVKPAITPEMTEKLLALLRVLGYQQPQEILVEFVAKYDLVFLLEAIEYICQIPPATTTVADNNPLTLRWGQLIMGLVAGFTPKPSLLI